MRSRSTPTSRELLALSLAAGVLIAGLACADKAPPARFRDPPPPTLAKPLPPEQIAPKQDEAQDDQTGSSSSMSSDSGETGDGSERDAPTEPSDPPPATSP